MQKATTTAPTSSIPPMAEPTAISAVAAELRPLLLSEGDDDASGIDDVGVVVEADEIRLVDEDFGKEDV